MNAVSRFDAKKHKTGRLRLRSYAPLAGYAAAGAALLALLFQLFFRYQYLDANGATWRIDRLTQQICRINIGHADCEVRSPATVSTSVSTSTSTSTSTSLKLPARKHGKQH